MTSLPIPSAGMRPILRDCLVAVEKDRRGILNILDKRLIKMLSLGRNVPVTSLDALELPRLYVYDVY